MWSYLPTPRVQKSGDIEKSLHCENVIFDNVQEQPPKIAQKEFRETGRFTAKLGKTERVGRYVWYTSFGKSGLLSIEHFFFNNNATTLESTGSTKKALVKILTELHQTWETVHCF